MAVDHRAQVDDLLAEYRRSREQLTSVHHQLAAVRESAASEDGLVRVTVSGSGTLLGLDLDEEVYHRLRPAQLATVITRLTAQAAEAAARASSEAITPVLPPGTDPAALLRGTADLSAPELKPPRPDAVTSDDDGDESYENVTWMRHGGKRP